MKLLVCLCVALSAVVASVEGQCLTLKDVRNPHPDAKNTLYTGEQDFALKLLQAINSLNPQDNLFFSPYSTYHALLLAYFVSSRQTESFLKKVLGLDSSLDKTDVFNAYKLDKLRTQSRARDSSYEFTNANRIYVDSGVTVRDCIPSIFRDEFQSVDFLHRPDKTRIDINKWVENQTHDMIKDLLPPGSIDQTTNLVLVNAAYFKGVWENKFDAAETRLEIFYITPSKNTLVDMMHVKGAFNHDISEELDAHILELPYEGEDVSMYILLPPFVKEDAVSNTLKKLTTDRFKALVSNNSRLSPEMVNLSLPKFSLEHTIEMTPILEYLGLTDLFSSSANFSTLTNDRLRLSNALHKAKIEVNEYGTKAAAATVGFSFRSSRPAEPAQFICNHPFVYVIYDKTEESILFTGIFRRPY